MTVQVVSFFFSNCTDHIIEVRLHKYALYQLHIYMNTVRLRLCSHYMG